MSNAPNSISPSQLDSMSCRFAWYLTYRKRYRPKKSSVPLEFGTAIHHALERYYGYKEDPVRAFQLFMDAKLTDAAWENDRDKIAEMRELGSGMLTAYLKHYAKERFDVICTEQTIRRRLCHPETGEETDCDILCRLDGIIRDWDTGKLFSLEHKTFSKFSPEQFERDHQFTAQVFVAEEVVHDKIHLPEGVIGVLYNGLRKQVESSRTKLAMFERHKIYRNQRQIEVFLHRAYWQYVETKREGLPIYPQPNVVRCGQCDYKDVCTSYMLGEDWRFILEEMYTCDSTKRISDAPQDEA